MGSEKFCLRWNDFETNISSAFRELRDDKDFFDVTLVCDDEQIQAHKVILSACSPFFCNILRRNPHQHPLLYLRGIKFTDLQSVLNFMYHGEVNIAQEELNSFLAVAEDLRVKGLTQNQSKPGNEKQESYSNPIPSKPSQIIKPSTHVITAPRQPIPPLKHVRSPPPPPAPSNTSDEDIQEIVPIKMELSDQAPANHRQLHPNQPFSTSQALAHQEDQSLAFHEDYDDYEHLADQEYQASMVVGDNLEGQFQDPSDLLQFVMETFSANKRYQCSLCIYAHNIKANVRNHVESVHYPNTFQYPCDQCDKLFPSKNNVQLHRSRMHKQKIKQ